jgi:hypothetical protein
MIRRTLLSPLHLIEKITQAPYRVLFLAWAGTMLAFAALYWTMSTFLPPEHGLSGLAEHTLLGRAWASLYFSIVTATTVGYGDIVPLGMSRVVAGMEAIIGFLLFAIFIAKLVAYRHEIALHQVHKLSFETTFAQTREGFFIMRKDFDSLMREAAKMHALSAQSWEDLTIAYREGQSLLEEIPDFYDGEHQLYTIDSKRESLLLEAVERTLRRIAHTLESLRASGVDWSSHTESATELRHFLGTVGRIVQLWRSKSPHGHEREFQEILRTAESIGAKS